MKPILACLASFMLCTTASSVTAASLVQNTGAIVTDQSQAAPMGEEYAQTQSGFERWVIDFRGKALANGVSLKTYNLAFRGVRLNTSVMEKDRKQSEFTKQLWEYLDSAVSDTRVKNGRKKYKKMRKQVLQIEARYGVDAAAFIAIWGLESAYGEFMGDINIIEALATLAYEGRRQKFGEQQLLEALKIIQRGDITPSRMNGSWAGAMGHTQFIPTSYQAYAQDFDGDGRRNVWDKKDPRDALASSANYLRQFGWRQGHPWGVEVQLPAGFNYSNADPKLKRPVSRWTELGVKSVNGDPLPDFGEAAMLAPAGANGPVFAVFKNFYVIKRYNNADAYAIAVGHLADRIMGGSSFKGEWPRKDDALSRREKIELQKKLTRAGFSTDGVDGIIGPNTISAVRSFQSSIGLIPDGYISKKLLARLR